MPELPPVTAHQLRATFSASSVVTRVRTAMVEGLVPRRNPTTAMNAPNTMASTTPIAPPRIPERFMASATATP